MNKTFFKRISMMVIATLLAFVTVFAAGCDLFKAPNKKYTLTVNEEDTEAYSIVGGFFSVLYAHTIVTLELDEEAGTYTLTKLLENTEEGKKVIADRGYTKSVRVEYVFQGQYVANEDGTITLMAATYGTGIQEWGDLGPNSGGLIEDMPLTTSEEDESILDWFYTPYVNVSANVDQDVVVDDETGALTFVEE